MSVAGWYSLVFTPNNRNGMYFKMQILDGKFAVPGASVKIWSTSNFLKEDFNFAFCKYAFADEGGYVNLYQLDFEQ